MFSLRQMGSWRWLLALLVSIGCSGALGTQIGAAQDQPPTVFLVPDGGTGVMLTDPDGWTLYTWFGDRPGASSCYGPCADAWPPYLVDGDVVAPIGMQANLGTVLRDDGTAQVALDGWPLYYFSGDGAPGTKTGDEVVEFNFTWQVAAYPPRVPSAANAPGVPVAVPDGPSPSFSAPPPPPGVAPTLIPAVSPFNVAPRPAAPTPNVRSR